MASQLHSPVRELCFSGNKTPYFRTIPLGDLDCVTRSVLNDGAKWGGESILWSVLATHYSARIDGRQSDMTVTLYEGENAELAMKTYNKALLDFHESRESSYGQRYKCWTGIRMLYNCTAQLIQTALTAYLYRYLGDTELEVSWAEVSSPNTTDPWP
ncbi:hypothetical protein C8R44DRAFT_860272 [Mycena epipterygia]|nr:hypothetical protein C8R44DRAFT_860272 [Mycena epipterygia]